MYMSPPTEVGFDKRTRKQHTRQIRKRQRK